MQLSINYTLYQKNLTVKTEKGKRYIFCIIRKKYLVLQPEELVRQLVIQYLINAHNISKNKINVEKQLLVNGLQKRFDIIVYKADLSPFLLIECKAPKIKMSQATFDQIAQYNMTLKVPYLLITNGIYTYSCAIDFEAKDYTFLSHIPKLT